MAEQWIKDYCKEIGKTRQYIQKLNSQGKINFRKVNNKVMIDLDSANAFFGIRPTGTAKIKSGKSLQDEFKSNSASPILTSLTKIDIALKMAKLEKVKLDTKIKEEKYIDAEKAKKQFYDTGRQIRDNLLTIPGRIADKCFGQTKHEIEQILEREIKTALFSIIGENADKTRFN